MKKLYLSFGLVMACTAAMAQSQSSTSTSPPQKPANSREIILTNAPVVPSEKNVREPRQAELRKKYNVPATDKRIVVDFEELKAIPTVDQGKYFTQKENYLIVNQPNQKQ